ncbi:MAG: crotonase/enoyl-CoA hydratase family protein [Pseudomonadota bacterium]
MSNPPTPAEPATEDDRPVLVETDARGVATITLNRPARHNAMNAAMISALAEAAARLGADPAVRAVVIAGRGESFCAGADLDWMRAQAEATRDGRIAEAGRLAAMLGALDRLPKPLIARVHGQAFGGGLGLMAVADAAVVAKPGRFAFTEVRLGLTPATISPYVVTRIGRAGAREVFFSGRPFGAEDAVRLGLAAEAVAPEMLDQAVAGQVAPYLAAAPGAVAAAKALVDRLAPGPTDATVAMTVDALADRWESDEVAEGIDAFFAKRRPAWRDGR